MKGKEMVVYGARIAQKGAVVLAATTTFAMAQGSGYDVSSVTAAIALAVTAILAIGAAVVAGPRISVKVWKWISRAL